MIQMQNSTNTNLHFGQSKGANGLKDQNYQKRLAKMPTTQLAIFGSIFVKENINENDDVLEMSLRGR